MFPFKRKTASDASTSPELTEEERQRRKKFIIYPLMFLLFAGSMWLIFAPSEKEEEKQAKGFNTEVPDPMAAELIGDKKKAYEKEMMEQKEQERSRAMQSLSSMFGEMTGGETSQGAGEASAWESDPSNESEGYTSRHSAPQDGFHASASAYQDINRTLGSFYEAPREDPEKEELRARLAELENRMSSEQQSPAITVNDQMALLEKSYQLAAKYMPSGGGQQLPSKALVSDGETASERKAVATTRNGKAVAFPVAPVSEQVVSALAQPMSDSTFRSEYVKERNFLFQTAIGTASQTERNTISAVCITTRRLRTGKSYVSVSWSRCWYRAGRFHATPLSWERQSYRANGSPLSFLRWNITGTSSPWSWRCTIRTDKLGYSSPARWSAVPPRRLSQEWVLPQAAV